MSGHSKWSTIKHKKAKEDSRRGQLFTKLIREITVAAKMGGGDANANPRLRTAVAIARAASMPAANIERAIKKGTGELPGVSYEEFVFEGYGAGGVAVLVYVLSDNKNRIVSELRFLFSRYNGNLGEKGCVAWLFHKKGIITVEAQAVDEERLMEIALEAGAEDISRDGNIFEVKTAAEALEPAKGALERAGIAFNLAEPSMVADTTVKLEGGQAQSMMKLMEALEDLDDVQNVYANFDLPESVLQEA